MRHDEILTDRRSQISPTLQWWNAAYAEGRKTTIGTVDVPIMTGEHFQVTHQGGNNHPLSNRNK